MKITQKMYDLIKNSSNSKQVEIGGILGGLKSDTVSDIVLDEQDISSVCRFTYTPNVQFLNDKIAQWQEEEKTFLGIFHSHFSGCRMLSSMDTEYIENIMRAMPDTVKSLYFPVYTMPDQTLNVYKAKTEKGNTVIEKDELIIV